jgi:ParB family chromosome partitioning protein
MGKVQYRDKVIDNLEKLAKPHLFEGRVSIGLEQNVGEFYYIPIEDLAPFKSQARTNFDEKEIDALAQSIEQHGVRQPLTIIADEKQKGMFEVVSGERRLRAAQKAGLAKVPCILVKDQRLAEEIAIVENFHRKDLHPVELGIAFRALLDRNIFSSQVEISKKLAIPETVVSEYIRFADFDKQTRDYLVEHDIKARDKLRMLIKYAKDSDKIAAMLSKVKTNKSASIVRIALQNGDFKFQTNGLTKLSASQKQLLKDKLLSIAASL